MNLPQTHQDPAPTSEEVYQALLRSLRRRKGFGLVFVQCSPAQGERLIEQVEQDLPQKKVATLRLTEPINNLYELIDRRSDKQSLNILFIQGLEKSLEPYIQPGYGGEGDYYKLDTVPRILSHLNQQRENFRDHFGQLCFVFLLPRFAIKYFIRRAPDFFDWGSGIVELPTDRDLLVSESDRIVLQGDYQQYLTLSQKDRDRKILEIQSLLQEPNQTLESKANLLFEQGNLFAASQDYQSAIASLDAALLHKPDDHKAWYCRGYALRKLGRDEEAITSYDAALLHKPDDHKAWNNRGLALSDLGRYEEALANFDAAVQHKPDDHSVWNNRGNALGDLGRYEEALANYDAALLHKPEHHKAWYNRGLALSDLGRYEEAIASYDAAVLHKPDKHEAWYNRGNALVKLGRYEEAIASYDAAVQHQPDYPAAWYNKACAYGLLGQIDKAISDLKAAVSLDPKYREMAKTDADFDVIRGDDSFQTIIQTSAQEN
jgi:tetratricopeptide (TPR) repeat protein